MIDARESVLFLLAKAAETGRNNGACRIIQLLTDDRKHRWISERLLAMVTFTNKRLAGMREHRWAGRTWQHYVDPSEASAAMCTDFDDSQPLSENHQGAF